MNKHLRKCLTAALFLNLLFLALAPIVVFPKSAKAAVTVSQMVTTPDGKTYLQVDGKPFLYNPVQSYGTNIMWSSNLPQTNFAQMENFWDKAVRANYKVLTIALWWGNIETSADVFDWSIINQYIDWSNKYGIYLDLIWGGTNHCGGALLGKTPYPAIPPYMADVTRFFGNGTMNGRNIPFLKYGTGHDTDIDYMLSREKNAVTQLMNHIAVYDTQHRTISFQVENEPNFHPDSNDSAHPVQNYLNQIAKAVKDSNYVVATRLNLVGGGVSSVWKTPYIDAVGADPYTTSVSAIANAMSQTNMTPFVYIAENGGNYSNASSLMATAFVNGGFYNTFAINNAPTWSTGVFSTPYVQWALGVTPTGDAGYTDIKNFNSAVHKIGGIVARTAKANMLGFNIETDTPAVTYDQSKLIGDYTLGYSSSDGSIAMAVLDTDKLYLISDTAGSTTFKVTQQPVSVSVGHMDNNNNWVIDGTRSYTNNGNGTYSITYNSSESIKVQMPPPPNSIIVDNTDSGYTFDSPWSSSTTVSGYFGSDYVTDGSSGADPAKWAKATPNIPATGDYKIYMRWTSDTNRPNAAPLEIKYNGGTDTSKTVNQTINGGTWVLIGTYNLAAGTGNYVKLLATNAGYTVADAVKFVPVNVATIYEAENATTLVSTGASQTNFSDVLCSNGAGNKLTANGVNDYIEYDLTLAAPGTKNIKVGVKKNFQRGKFRLYLPQANQYVGTEQDEYSANDQYVEIDLGNYTFAQGGMKQFRFIVTGKNASSVGYDLAFDYIKITDQ